MTQNKQRRRPGGRAAPHNARQKQYFLHHLKFQHKTDFHGDPITRPFEPLVLFLRQHARLVTASDVNRMPSREVIERAAAQDRVYFKRHPHSKAYARKLLRGEIPLDALACAPGHEPRVFSINLAPDIRCRMLLSTLTDKPQTITINRVLCAVGIP